MPWPPAYMAARPTLSKFFSAFSPTLRQRGFRPTAPSRGRHPRYITRGPSVGGARLPCGEQGSRAPDRLAPRCQFQPSPQSDFSPLPRTFLPLRDDLQPRSLVDSSSITFRPNVPSTLYVSVPISPESFSLSRVTWLPTLHFFFTSCQFTRAHAAKSVPPPSQPVRPANTGSVEVGTPI